MDNVGIVVNDLPAAIGFFRELGLELERAIQLFERGSELANVCERIVDEAELRVTRLAAESASTLSDTPADT